MNSPSLRVRRVGGDWSRNYKCGWTVFPLKLPLEAGELMEVEIWDGPAPPDRGGGLLDVLLATREGRFGVPKDDGLLFRKQLMVPEWDTFLVFLHSRGDEAQRWFGKKHWIEAGWVSEYRPLAKKLRRARAW